MAKPDPDLLAHVARARAAHAKELAQAMRHDLRAPLRHVDSFAQLVRERIAGKLDAKESEFFERIAAAAQRADAMVVGVVKLLEHAAAARAFEHVDLAGAARAACDALRPALDGAGARVEIAALPTVFGDRVAFETLFRELLANAVAHRSQRPLVVEVEGERRDGAVVVRVRDNGRGFDPANADYIFAPFHRVGDPDPGEGAGVGLTLVRWIAEEHGGNVAAASAAGEGATFTVSLPDRSALDTSPR